MGHWTSGCIVWGKKNWNTKWNRILPIIKHIVISFYSKSSVIWIMWLLWSLLWNLHEFLWKQMLINSYKIWHKLRSLSSMTDDWLPAPRRRMHSFGGGHHPLCSCHCIIMCSSMSALSFNCCMLMFLLLSPMGILFSLACTHKEGKSF